MTTAPAKTTPPPPAHNLLIYTLDNGLEVVLRQDRSFPRVAVSVTYFVGQRDQPLGYRGLAHLTEHLMYQGSKNVGEDQYFVHLERAGGTDRNAQTGPDDTTYYQAVPSNHLPTVLWLESDRMAYMLQQLHQTTLDQQRSVVIRELREDEGHSPMSGLAEVIRRHRHEPAQRIAETLCRSAREFAGQTTSDDDTTVVVIRVLED